IQKTKEISDVWRFVNQLSESDFNFINSNKLLCLYKDGRTEVLLTNKSEIVEEWRNGHIINENQFYSEGKLESIFEVNIFKTLIINDDRLLVKHIDYEKEEIKYGIFDFSLKNIEWLADVGGSQPRMLVKDKNLISTTNSIVKSFILNNGITWQKSYSELTKSNKANLHSQILNGDDKLFFVVTGNERKGLFALDIKTGEVLKKFDGLCYEIFKEGNYIYTTQFENILCRINTKTLELETWDCNIMVTDNGFHRIHDHRCDVVNNRFCFTQSLGDNKAKLGVLDWDRKELVYKYEFKPENGAIGSVHVNDTRIFVHTQDNTLHIFEKE
ncbi:MAG: hypothetical protein MI922_16460, partial [Bacteroidales bacterium]|nr:hypothetical protein [Bacteroidales bacterium]